MPWGKVDDKLHGSPKWLATPMRARGLWAGALSWCMDQLTDGAVPSHVLRALGGTAKDAADLVRAGLWETSDTGWVFHDWLEFQPSREQILAERAAAAERQKRARERAKQKTKGGTKQNRDGLSPNKVQPGSQSGSANGHGYTDGDLGERSSVTRESRRDSHRDYTRESRSPRPDPTYKNNGAPRSTSEGYVTGEDEPPWLETSVPRHVLPTSWVPNTAHKAYAGERGIDLDHELHQFRAHCRSKRPTSLDWDAEFEKWLGNARTPSNGGSNGKSTTSSKVRDGIALAERLALEEASQSNVVHFPQIEGTHS